MSYTADDLVRKLGLRRHDLVLATPTSSGSVSTLVCSTLLSHYPTDVDELNVWVYGSLTADVANRGTEIRGLTWDATAKRITMATDWPHAITTGIYEIRQRATRAVYLEAINSGIAQLAENFYRPIRDESITTAANTYRYQLSEDIPWDSISGMRIEIQMSTSTSLVGFPYADATPWNPRITREVDDDDGEVWYLRFGRQPPSGRLVRISGPVGYSQLVADDDELHLEGQWGYQALEWLMTYASVNVDDWLQDTLIQGDVQKYQAILAGRIQRGLDQLLRTKQTRPNLLISVPGIRDASRPSGLDSLRYLSASQTPTA